MIDFDLDLHHGLRADPTKKWPLERFTKVPVNGLDGCILLESGTAKLTTFKISDQSFLTIQHNELIPLCFFPPNDCC